MSLVKPPRIVRWDELTQKIVTVQTTVVNYVDGIAVTQSVAITSGHLAIWDADLVIKDGGAVPGGGAPIVMRLGW